MEVEKINIKIETLDLPDDRIYWDFLALDPWTYPSKLVPSEQMPIRAKTETWRIMEVKHLGDIKSYLVKIDEQELFNDLIQISSELLKAVIDCRETTTKQLENERIKNLSWWRRLFRRF